MLETNLNEFEAVRADLERLAYRMLGTKVDADDIVQEAFLRWRNVDPTGIHSTLSYLRTVVTRLCIDRRREIEKRKESYIGTWLPEPIVEHSTKSSEDRVETAESVSFALMHLLETLTPSERAAYLLRRVFDYKYEEISEILGSSLENCRKLVSRAESHVLSGRPRFNPKPEDLQRISSEFLQACATGNIQSLVELLSNDVTIYSDGGGKAPAALRPIEGVDRVARFFIGIFKKAPSSTRIEMAYVNGQVGFVVYVGRQPVAVYSLEFANERISRFYVVLNPEKLTNVGMPPQDNDQPPTVQGSQGQI